MNNIQKAFNVLSSTFYDLYDTSPFDNTGFRFKNDVFEANAYDWSECNCEEALAEYEEWDAKKCTCGYTPQTYNFKYGDFEASWYKHFNRGFTCNKELPQTEINKMLINCLNSL